MQKDYKMFPPSVDWSNIDWSARRPQMDFPIQVFTKGYCFFALLCFLLPFFVDDERKLEDSSLSFTLNVHFSLD